MNREMLAVTDVHQEIVIRLHLTPKFCVEVSNEAG